MAIEIEFCGEITAVSPDETVTVGREADVLIDDNPYLHRQFLSVAQQPGGVWVITNVGSRLAATVSDVSGQMEAFLAPGGALPIIFGETRVAFTAGPTGYELTIRNPDPQFSTRSYATSESRSLGVTTIGPKRFTRDQLLLVVALSEPRLLGEGRAITTLPTSAEAAQRLNWPLTKFNRKLDNVCEKLDKVGVKGLRGGEGELAMGRRARLVEYAVATRLVTRQHLAMLDESSTDRESGEAKEPS